MAEPTVPAEPEVGAGPPGAAAGPDEPGDVGETVAVLRDRWLRAEADLQNYRRRAQREVEDMRRHAEESVMLEIVDGRDDLERALDAAPADGPLAAWAEGVGLVAQHLRESLARRGVTVVDPAGEPFDPTFHDALLELPAPDDVVPGTVLQVALKGYRRGTRALRPARVVVARSGGAEG